MVFARTDIRTTGLPALSMPYSRSRKRRMHKKTVVVALASFLLSGNSFAQAPGVFTNLGSINFNAPITAPNILQQDGGPFNGGQIQWYQFTLSGGGVTAGNGRFLDIFTTKDPSNPGNIISGQVDSEIGLYDLFGNLLNTDDDDGASFLSQLTYGATGTTRTVGAGGAYPNAQPAGASAAGAFNGRDLALAPGGSLPDGTYWLAVANFNASFGTTNWTVTSTNTFTADNSVRLVFGSGGDADTVVPEPGTLALLALGLLPGLGLLRRRT